MLKSVTCARSVQIIVWSGFRVFIFSYLFLLFLNGAFTSLDKSRMPIRFGTAISPLNTSDRFQTSSSFATHPKNTALRYTNP